MIDEIAFRSIFTKTVWERRHGLLAWSIGIAALVIAVLSVWPSVRDEYGKLVENYPEGLLAFLGVEKGGLGSARGYLQAELFGLMVPLTLLGYAIAACSAIVAGEEEHGTLSMLLAQPVSRGRVVLEKYAAIVLAIAVLSTILAVVLAVATRLFGLDVKVVDQLAATASAFLLALVFGAITLALGCATGRRTAAAGGASALAVAAYLLTSLAGLVEGLRRFRPLSPFWWYSGNDPLRNGLSVLHVSLLVTVTVCALLVAVYTFVRRDIH